MAADDSHWMIAIRDASDDYDSALAKVEVWFDDATEIEE
jgi:hypothetical protein